MLDVKRLVVASLLASASAYIGYTIGAINSAKLEQVVDHTYRIKGPDKQNYLADFQAHTLRPEHTALEELFEEKPDGR